MIKDNIFELMKTMCQDITQRRFAPILEADICGYLFHLAIVSQLSAPANIHLSTRVQGSSSSSDKFDFVIGEIDNSAVFRPRIIPELVGEVKIFPIGFSGPQCNRRFHHVIEDDLRKLGQLRNAELIKIEIIYDEKNYLSGKCNNIKREKMIADTRNDIAPGVAIIVARKIGGEWEVISY